MNRSTTSGREWTTRPTSETTAVVFVVDDDISVRDSLEQLIGCAGWRVQTFGSAQEFLARPPVECPSCLVLDISLPGLSGLDLQTYVAADCTDMPIIFITGHADIPMTVQAMKAGAVEFLTKPFSDDVLLRAVQHAVDRSHAERVRQAQLRTLRDCYASLSRREREVMASVVAGRLNKQIAAELGISEITAKAHRGHVIAKDACRFAGRSREQGRETTAPIGALIAHEVAGVSPRVLA